STSPSATINPACARAMARETWRSSDISPSTSCASPRTNAASSSGEKSPAGARTTSQRFSATYRVNPDSEPCIALELLAASDGVLKRALQHGHLILDIDLPGDAGPGQGFIALLHRNLDLSGQRFVLRVELVETRRGDVLDGLDPPELGPHLVDRLVNLANGLSHGGLGNRILHGVEKGVDAAADDACHPGSNVISHGSPPSSCVLERRSRRSPGHWASVCRSRPDYSIRRCA